MATGLRIRDQVTGAVKLDTSYRMGRVLGVLTTQAYSGSVGNSGLTQGELFYRLGLVPTGAPNTYPSTNFINQLSSLSIFASGAVLSWAISWPAGLPAGYSFQIVYGVY